MFSCCIARGSGSSHDRRPHPLAAAAAPCRVSIGRYSLAGGEEESPPSMPPPLHGRAALAVAAVLLLAVAAAGQLTAVDPDAWAAADDDGRAAACAAGTTVEECVAGGGGTARRELWQNGYISYDAMSRGRVPCSYRGASYYNCRPGGPANPYSRGCSQITRCRG